MNLSRVKESTLGLKRACRIWVKTSETQEIIVRTKSHVGNIRCASRWVYRSAGFQWLKRGWRGLTNDYLVRCRRQKAFSAILRHLSWNVDYSKRIELKKVDTMAGTTRGLNITKTGTVSLHYGNGGPVYGTVCTKKTVNVLQALVSKARTGKQLSKSCQHGERLLPIISRVARLVQPNHG